MASSVNPDPVPPAASRFSIGSRLSGLVSKRRVQRTQDVTRLAFSLTATIGVAAIAVVVCIWRPDALAALTLIPAWCWLVAGLLSSIPAWRIRDRRIACALTVLWIAFA